MIHNLKIQASSWIRQLSFLRRYSYGITRDAIVMVGILAAVSLVSVLVFVETLFP